MTWSIELSDAFEQWWHSLGEDEKIEVHAHILLLKKYGPHLPYPYSSGVKGAKTKHMRELRIQFKGAPYRVLYAFDHRRIALLLVGGNKKGDERWYRTMIPKADMIYQELSN